jgi:transcriptional regulator with XRE-family HTH domain
MARSGNTLGALIHLVRERNGWTLREMSDQVGIPLSTLAKVEADKLSLTYDKLQQLTSRLGMTMTEFLGQQESSTRTPPGQVVTARRSLTAEESSIRMETANYEYEYLCADLREKRMVPILARVRAHDISEFGEPLRHEGEEFIYVLEGSIEVHLQFYTPVVLKAGQGIYIDSTMGHAYVAKDCESALVLAVCSGENPALEQALISLVESELQDVPSRVASLGTERKKR